MYKKLDVTALTDVENLRQALDYVKKNGEQYLLTDNGEPQAVLLSLHDIELLKRVKRNVESAWEDVLDVLKNAHPPNVSLSAEEKKARAVKRLYDGTIKHRLAFAKAVAEGKINPLPKDIPLEQVWQSLSGIEGSLADEVIKEREEGW
ncbi:MAG: hypothetical protein ACREOI_06300 [bacterium]